MLIMDFDIALDTNADDIETGIVNNMNTIFHVEMSSVVLFSAQIPKTNGLFLVLVIVQEH